MHYLQSILNNLDRTLLERLTFVRECCTRLKINKAISYNLVTNKEEDIVHPPRRDAVAAPAPSGLGGSGLLMTEVPHRRSWVPGLATATAGGHDNRPRTIVSNGLLTVLRPAATHRRAPELLVLWPQVWARQGWGFTESVTGVHPPPARLGRRPREQPAPLPDG